MFILKLYDRNGKLLKLGDIVKISNGKHFTFFCEVKYLAKENVITPFHTFSFHSVVKIDNVPKHAVASTEERYKIWYVYEEDADKDIAAHLFESYLSDWRACEHLLGSRCFRIDMLKDNLKQEIIFNAT